MNLSFNLVRCQVNFNPLIKNIKKYVLMSFTNKFHHCKILNGLKQKTCDGFTKKNTKHVMERVQPRLTGELWEWQYLPTKTFWTIPVLLFSSRFHENTQ